MGDRIGSLLNSDTQVLRSSAIQGHAITYEAFARAVFSDLREFQQNLDCQAFIRGLPGKEYLQDILIKDVFSVVLEEGFLDAGRLPESHAGAVEKCFRMGWLHKSLRNPDDDFAEILVFPSPLHRWYTTQPSGIGSITNYSSGIFYMR